MERASMGAVGDNYSIGHLHVILDQGCRRAFAEGSGGDDATFVRWNREVNV